MLAGAPNLNDTKFRMARIYSSLPTDLETARKILQFPAQADEGLFRFLLFFGGSTARALRNVSFGGIQTPDSLFPPVSSATTLLPAEIQLYNAI